jgi:hypothetical protein
MPHCKPTKWRKARSFCGVESSLFETLVRREASGHNRSYGGEMKGHIAWFTLGLALLFSLPASAGRPPIAAPTPGLAPTAAPVRVSVPLSTEALSFELSDQEGEFTVPCSTKLIPHAGDFAVACDLSQSRGPRNSDQTTDVLSFTVHAKLFVHERAHAPKLSYEFLYWVTNHRAQTGGKGKYLGTTLWFNFDEPTALSSLEAGQDVEDIWVLRMKVKLK